MKKEFNQEYVEELESRLKKAEAELHAWRFNGVYLNLEDKLAVWTREQEQLAEKMDEEERREMERIDRALEEMGL